MVALISVLIFLLEFKNEVGSNTGGDPIFQQMRALQMYYEDPDRANSDVRRADACPALLVEVVGPLLRISAAASLRGNTVMTEPLTPFLHCLKVDGQRECVPPPPRMCFALFVGALPQAHARRMHTHLQMRARRCVCKSEILIVLSFPPWHLRNHTGML